MKLVLLLSLFAGLSLQAAVSTTQQLNACLQDYGKNVVPEHNLPNDSVLVLKSAGTIASLDKMLKFAGFGAQHIKNQMPIVTQAEALGIVANYEDELHLMYVGVSVVNGKCVVKEAFDSNTVDIDYSVMKDVNELSHLMLGMDLKTLKKRVPTVYMILTDEFKNSRL